MKGKKKKKMLNAEKYRDEIQKILDRGYDIAIEKETKKIVACDDTCCDNCALNSKSNCSLHIERWLISEYKEQILTEEEREYLSSFIKPFRKKVEYIAIWGAWNGSKQFVHIELSDMDYANLPNFETNTMYKGMKPRKHYSLEELGL